MNENNTQRSEQIASKILRVLAIVGLVAVLALATWSIVQGAKLIPNLGENLSAAVTSVKSIFQKAPQESLVFELEAETIPVGNTTTFTWNYTGEKTPETYSFSFACGTEAQFSVMDGTGWTELKCDAIQEVKDNSISLIPINNTTRFADIVIKVEVDELEDTAIVTVVNTDILATNNTDAETDRSEDDESSETIGSDTTANTTNSDASQNNITPTKNTPSGNTQTVVRRTTNTYTGPADLVIEIQETGIILEVDGEDVFFPVSPIPSDKVAGVTFTVTNRGGEKSNIWTFDAELPIEGNDDYEYSSPKQMALASGMQIEYTLGFDEILQDEEGRIRITLDPNDNDDKTSNNTDSVNIVINEKD